jgi:hypothetical protein
VDSRRVRAAADVMEKKRRRKEGVSQRGRRADLVHEADV